MSLSAKILIGMVLGIIAGIFFGEEVAFLQIIGEGFIQLLQMSVLPFVTLSLIVGLG
ncbi:MAG: cation:dicarboxylate symporter family transporter, partial [Nitrospiraceae bacterium]